jgi:hypothetical protein
MIRWERHVARLQYVLILCILAGKCEQKRFLGKSSGRWKDDNNKIDPRLRIGVRQRPVVGCCEHIMGSLLWIKGRRISYLAIRGVLDPSYFASSYSKIGCACGHRASQYTGLRMCRCTCHLILRVCSYTLRVIIIYCSAPVFTGNTFPRPTAVTWNRG